MTNLIEYFVVENHTVPNYNSKSALYLGSL